MKNKGFVGKCKTASGEEAQNLKHEIRNEEVFTAKAGEELLGIGDWLLGEENEEADSFKGSASVSLAVSRILRGTSSERFTAKSQRSLRGAEDEEGDRGSWLKRCFALRRHDTLGVLFGKINC
jgi:hypothetical protein